MKVIVLEKNALDAFVALEDGSIATIPLKLISNTNVGESVHLSDTNISCSRNAVSSNTLTNSFIDFF